MRPIYRSKEHKKLIDTLRDRDPKTGENVFTTIKDLQCYAAMLGFQMNRREPFDRKTDAIEDIQWATFDDGKCPSYIYLIALAETGNVSVLRYDIENSDTGGYSEDMVKIFEEYANGGFHVLQSWLDKTPGDPYGASAVIQGLKKEGFLKKKETGSEFDPVEF